MPDHQKGQSQGNDPIIEQSLVTTCCIVGGGPAGIMLAYLLARSGIQVTVLEKHKDFFRDFRGDTVHPSTLEVFYELGLLEEFLKLPHQELTSVGGILGDFEFRTADFRHVPSHCKFVALMPQWDFLNFLVRRARRFPAFDLRAQHEAVDVIQNGRRIEGVVVRAADGQIVEVRADLVVACDGRHSTVRKAARLEVMDFGVPIDVLWFRIRREPGDPEQLFGNINFGKALVMINRGDYFQAGLIIPKGSFEQMKQGGIDQFRQIVRRIAPYLGDRTSELRDWEQVKLLTVQINRLRRWFQDGLLCIGDAAHAMSPAGGVGINLAIQDAVAAARLLARPLHERRVTEAVLQSVQERREFPARATQFLQLNAHKAFARIFRETGPIHPPWQLKVAVRVPGVQRLMGRVIGIGVRPEHVREAPKPTIQTRAMAVCVGIATGFAVAAVMLTRPVRRGAGARAVKGSRSRAAAPTDGATSPPFGRLGESLTSHR